MFGLGLPELVILIVIITVYLPQVYYVLTLQKAISICSPVSRRLSPRLV